MCHVTANTVSMEEQGAEDAITGFGSTHSQISRVSALDSDVVGTRFGFRRNDAAARTENDVHLDDIADHNVGNDRQHQSNNESV